MHGMTGKKNALKPADKKASESIHITCTKAEKETIVRRAHNSGLSVSRYLVLAGGGGRASEQ